MSENKSRNGFFNSVKKVFAFREKKLGPAKKALIFGGLALIAAIIIFLLIKFWTFSHYKVEVSDTKENTLVYNYYSVDGNILKCASDTATLSDSKNESIWTITYEMNEPCVAVCGDKFVIYEKNGTNIIRCDSTGKKDTFNSQLPIVRAEIAKQGTVAVLMDDGSTAQIDYYDKDGSLIATIKTTLDKDGYPMDIALTRDGMMLAVSYIKYDQGRILSEVDFYNFGAAGQIVNDNIVSSYSYEDVVIPQVDFMDGGNCVAFGTNKIVVYDSSKNPKEISIIEAEDEIRSVVVGGNYFATVMTGNENAGYEISIYNKRGGVKANVNTSFSYTSMEMRNDLLIMYNRNSMNIYSTDGILKFDGQFEFFVRQIRLIDSNRYALAATDSYNIVRLY